MATSSYVLPAIFLNPVFILHSMNTYFSYRFPPSISASTSPHSTMEKWGPLPGSTPYFDVHANEHFCIGYTLVMVCAQVLAFSKIGGNRIRKKSKLRRDGKDIKHSRWSEPEESPMIQMEISRSEKMRERFEMEKRKSVNGMDGTNDHGARPVTRSQSRKQVRSIRNRNGHVDVADPPEDCGGVADFLDDEKDGEEDIEAANVDGDEDEEDESDENTSETSEEVMII